MTPLDELNAALTPSQIVYWLARINGASVQEAQDAMREAFQNHAQPDAIGAPETKGTSTMNLATAAPTMIDADFTAYTPTPAPQGPHAVNLGAGTINTRVSSNWWTRPDDQRFMNLDDMFAACKKSADSSKAQVIDCKALRMLAPTDDANDLRIALPDATETKPSHYSFGQLAGLVGAPAGYLRSLPAQLAGINLQYGLAEMRSEAVKTYTTINEDNHLRAITGPDYGRVFDYEIVDAVRKFAGNGTGENSAWKIPGVMKPGSGMYDPRVVPDKQSTTLYASDRDCFIFLCDDLHPIEIGKIPGTNEPDLIFRGFMVWNSEVGSRSLGLATMYLRAVCQNRMLWGVEGYKEFRTRHSKNAPDRWIQEAAPALKSFMNASPTRLLAGVNAAQSAIVATDDDARAEFLQKNGFTKPETNAIIAQVIRDTDAKPKSIWDFVQGITAIARDKGHQDARVDFERRAGNLLAKVK